MDDHVGGAVMRLQWPLPCRLRSSLVCVCVASLRARSVLWLSRFSLLLCFFFAVLGYRGFVCLAHLPWLASLVHIGILNVFLDVQALAITADVDA